MLLPDVNVLIYAFLADAADHRAARAWLNSMVCDRAPYGLSPQVLASFIRVTTNARVFAHPDPLEDSLRFAHVLLHRPNCQIVEPGTRHWGIYTDLCRKAKPPEISRKTPGSRPWPSSRDANGSLRTGTTPDFQT